MQGEHHDLVHEFPEHRERIHDLKISDNHFRRLMEEYNDLTSSVENLEGQGEPISDEHMEEMKKKRVRLKDDLYQMLQEA